MTKRMHCYSGFQSKFNGIGFMVSYKDTPIWEYEEIVFTVRLCFYKFWIAYKLNVSNAN